MIFRRTAAALLLTAVALGSTALPASAHTELKSSNPASGAALPAPPQQVELTFTEAVTAPADAITVSGPDGAKWTVGQVTVAGPVVTAPVQATGPAGAYTIAWKVVSDDGDPVTGTIGFTLAAAATTTTTPPTTTTPTTTTTSAAAEPSTPPAAQPAEGGGVPGWVWIVIAAVVLAGVGVIVAVRRKGAAR
jgi:methionine-rich copper-binding protein CopC